MCDKESNPKETKAQIKEEPKDLEFLACKSQEFIDKQISAYRQKHANAGSVIAIIALFIPFFLNGLDDSFGWLKILSVLPVGLFLYSVHLLLSVLKTKSLDQGFHPDKFLELANYNDYEKILLYEIGANQSSFKDNEKITQQASNSFNLGIRLTLISVVVSIIILLINNFWKPSHEDKPQKIEIVNIHKLNKMANDKNDAQISASSTGNNADNKVSGTRDIPMVPPSDRINLNETVIDIQTKTDSSGKDE